MALFLSFAEEDQEVAFEIAAWFQEHGLEIYHYRDIRQRGGRIVQRTESQIYRAEAFLVLISPDYLASPWCRRERDLAMDIEAERQEKDPDYTFIHVLQVSDRSCPRPGFLRGYDWLDLTTKQKRKETLPLLSEKLRPSKKAAQLIRVATSPGQAPSLFVNRGKELTEVLGGLAQADGPHFWLVISPPELGKSWFLKRLSVQLGHPKTIASAVRRPHWVTRLVDVREQPREARGDAGLILASLFGVTPPVTIESEMLQRIARKIIDGGQAHLCLLDSAELLEEEATGALRWGLSQIHDLVKKAGKADVCLAFVVASRHERGWRGVTPSPRLSLLALAEFEMGDVMAALEELAQEMNRRFPGSELAEYGALLYRVSEGLPALLMRGLQWIKAEEWQDIGRLDTQEVFRELVQTYVEKGLLSSGSLFPWEEGHLEGRRRVLDRVFQVLARYRIFTQSHLQHAFEHDPPLKDSLAGVGWSVEDVWAALDRTPLLSRPLDEPWHEIHPAIRRLLFRYYYRSSQERAAAHMQARDFVEAWSRNLVGEEQIVGLVECLWHEACFLLLDRPEALKSELCAYARKISQDLESPRTHSVAERHIYTAERVVNDEELRETVDKIPDLLEQLRNSVARPEQGIEA